MNKVYLDKEGYEKLEESINNLYVNLNKVIDRMNYVMNNNFDKETYNELLNLKESIEQRINEKKEFLNSAIIITEEISDDKIKLHDVVKINTYFSEDDIETECYELVSEGNDLNSEIIKISINTSPIGKALYGKYVGDVFYLNINNEKLKIEILEKVDSKKLIKKN